MMRTEIVLEKGGAGCGAYAPRHIEIIEVTELNGYFFAEAYHCSVAMLIAKRRERES